MRMRTPPVRQQGVEIRAASDGVDYDSAPDAVPMTRAPIVENFLVDRPGRLLMRGPINEASSIFGGAGVKPMGAWVHNNNLLIGAKAVSATAVREPWAAPFRRAASAAELATPAVNAFHVNLETGIVTTIAPAVGTMPGARSARLGAFTYGPGFASATSSTQNGGVIFETQLLRWDGTAIVPTAYASAPKASQDVKAHLDRLFVLGGIEPGTATYRPNALYWSDPDGPTADTLAMWQDDVTGLVNKIIVDSDDPSDFGVALGRCSSNLVVFKRRSIHVLYGQTVSSFNLKPFTLEQGCLDPRSVLDYEGGCFFMSDQGFMFFDGAQLRNTTSQLRSVALARALANVGDRGLDGGFVTAGRLPNGYVSLSIGSRPSSVLPSLVDFCGILHVASGNWASLTSDILAPNRPILSGRTLSRTFVMDDIKVVQASKITAPESADPTERGIDVADVTLTYDASGNLFYSGAGSTLKNTTTLVEAYPATGTSTAAIHPIWFSRLIPLSDPQARSRILRLLLDYTFNVAGARNDDTFGGWFVKLVDGQGNVLLPEFQVPSQAGVGVSTYAYRRQLTKDVFTEANDAQLRVEWRGNPLALENAAIFNSVLEYHTAASRRSG